MDAELLEQLQISGARVRAGEAVGLIDGYHLGTKNTVRIRPESGDLVEVDLKDVEAVDPVDEEKVAAAVQRREQEALGFQLARSIANQPPVVP